MNKKKTLLILGGTGFIGYHLAGKALKKGWKVTSISARAPKKLRFLSKVSYLICDINNKKKLKKTISKEFTYVVNLAGYVDHSNKRKTFNSHYVGCKNLVEIFLKFTPQSFVQMGSSLEYGKSKSPQKETINCQPLSTYGRAKFLASKYLLSMYKEYNFPVTILRLYQAYGNKQDINRFIPIVINSCLKRNDFPCSKGDQLRDFVHIDDVVQAIFKSFRNRKSRGEIINIGSGRGIKIKNIIQLIRRITNGGKPQFGKIKLRSEEALKVYPSIKKAKKYLNWKPQILFRQGIKSVIKSYDAIRN